MLLVLAAVIAFVVIGIAIFGLVVKLLWWVLLGLVLGAIARLILPGKQQIGLLATAGAGIAGSLLGGIIGHILGVGNLLQFVIAAVAAVVIVGAVSATDTAVA